jgi:hypothetical protein
VTEQALLAPIALQPIDILFIVDDSCSMRDDQTALADNFGAFIKGFEGYGLDFHLGVVTTDMRAATRSGRLVAPFLTNATPDLEKEFAAMVNVGTKGSGTEMGLGAAMAALSEPLASHENAGFIRANAGLALVFLTDENDSSAVKPPQFVDFLRALKPAPDAVSVAAILGLKPSSGCNSGSFGAAYVQVASAFGRTGMVVRCTSQFAAAMESVSSGLLSARCTVPIQPEYAEYEISAVRMNQAGCGFKRWPGDDVYSSGSVEISPCVASGGLVEIDFLACPPPTGP